MAMNYFLKSGRRLHELISNSLKRFKDDLLREFNFDFEETKALVEDKNNSRRPSSDDSDSDDESSSDDSTESSYSDDESEETNEEPTERKRKCCLFCACFECCLCFHLPGSFICDKIYYKLQNKIDGCPTACPTLIPRSVEEEWRFKGGYGSRFAICECCASPGCIICLKCTDTILCPLCTLWEIVKGIDFGYRRFRIQAYIYRHYEAERGFRTIWI